jgi:hypothetical protein
VRLAESLETLDGPANEAGVRLLAALAEVLERPEDA